MRNCRNYNRNHFFSLKICIHYVLYREFSNLPEKKSLPPRVPISTQNPDLTHVPPIQKV